MKKIIAIVAIFASFSAMAMEPVPMVDVAVSPSGMDIRTQSTVPAETAHGIRKAYTQAMNETVQERGKLDILAVGSRATVVITEYFDPRDAMSIQNTDAIDIGTPGHGNPAASMNMRGGFRDNGNGNRQFRGQPAQAKIAGYVEFEGRKLPFVETASPTTPMSLLVDNVGRTAFMRILAM